VEGRLQRSAKTGKAYLGYRPSKKSIKRMVETIHALTALPGRPGARLQERFRIVKRGWPCGSSSHGEAAKFNLDIQSVVSMRLMKIAAGGAEAVAEYVRMVQEKVYCRGGRADRWIARPCKRQERQGGDESGNGPREEKGSCQSQAVIRRTQSETILSHGRSACR
jgi:hypothetical protein